MMTIRGRAFALAVLLSLSMCGCSAAADTDAVPASSAGTLELAVSETCAAESDPQCVRVGDEDVMRPATFDRAAKFMHFGDDCLDFCWMRNDRTD